MLFNKSQTILWYAQHNDDVFGLGLVGYNMFAY